MIRACWQRRRHHGLGALPAVFLVALGACVDSSDTPDLRDSEVHPNAENAVPSDAALIVEDSLPDGMGIDALDAWRSARDDLMAARTVMTLGREEEGPQLFGRIGDVAVDATGNVFVFDPLAMELRVFDSTGSYVSGVGGFGDGPLELRYNLFGVFELLDEGRVLVVNGAVTKLFLETEGQWRLDKTVEAPGFVTDACVIGDRAFFAGWRADDNTLVQTASLATGAADAGLVPGYRHPDYLVRSKMAEGVRIACLATAEQTIVAWGHLPMIASYRFGQESPAWTSRVGGRLPSRIVYGMASDQTGAERLAIEDQTDPRDFLNTLLPISSGHLWFSTRERRATGPPLPRFGRTLSTRRPDLGPSSGPICPLSQRSCPTDTLPSSATRTRASRYAASSTSPDRLPRRGLQ